MLQRDESDAKRGLSTEPHKRRATVPDTAKPSPRPQALLDTARVYPGVIVVVGKDAELYTRGNLRCASQMPAVSNVLRLSWREADSFISAVYSQKSVSGFTHSFYKYPGRFSPDFARASIEVFSRPGDVVVDPFVGGGTSLVESRVAGRIRIGRMQHGARIGVDDDVGVRRGVRWTA